MGSAVVMVVYCTMGKFGSFGTTLVLIPPERHMGVTKVLREIKNMLASNIELRMKEIHKLSISFHMGLLKLSP